MSNVVGGSPASRPWQRYDALPPGLKRLVMAAPYNLHPNWWEERLAMAHGDARHAGRMLTRDIARLAAWLIERDYGADHPCIARMDAIARGEALATGARA